MEDFDLKKYLADNRLLKEELDVNKILSDGGYDIIDDEELLMTVKSRLRGKNNIDAEKLNLLVMKIEDEEGGNIDFTENKLLKEFVGGELEDRNEPLYDELVPVSGDAETLEGEMLRAINKIIYRYYNDGDKYYEGYGTETAGPAHSFLVNANHPLKATMNRLFKEFISDDEYEKMVKDILDVILDHIEYQQGDYTKNTLGGMFDYEPEYEDDEEDYDDYYDDEEDYYQE
jgi:hypothetical protein